MATTTDQPAVFKPKKSVALSGTPAGNTALCTVGRTGNDLHYRGYDIADLAAHCEFEEVAYLLLRGKLPNATELAAYKQKLTRLRGLPANVYEVLEQLPAKDRQLLRAIFLEEKEKDVVCREMGVDREYLRVLVYRAKDKFKALYQKGQMGNAQRATGLGNQ